MADNVDARLQAEIRIGRTAPSPENRAVSGYFAAFADLAELDHPLTDRVQIAEIFGSLTELARENGPTWHAVRSSVLFAKFCARPEIQGELAELFNPLIGDS